MLRIGRSFVIHSLLMRHLLDITLSSRFTLVTLTLSLHWDGSNGSTVYAKCVKKTKGSANEESDNSSSTHPWFTHRPLSSTRM